MAGSRLVILVSNRRLASPSLAKSPTGTLWCNSEPSVCSLPAPTLLSSWWSSRTLFCNNNNNNTLVTSCWQQVKHSKIFSLNKSPASFDLWQRVWCTSIWNLQCLSYVSSVGVPSSSRRCVAAPSRWGPAPVCHSPSPAPPASVTTNWCYSIHIHTIAHAKIVVGQMYSIIIDLNA